MEALGSGSAIHVFPAYYEKAVQYKVLRDAESAEMLDLIRETRIIDLAECPWYETVRLPVEKMMMTINMKKYAICADSPSRLRGR